MVDSHKTTKLQENMDMDVSIDVPTDVSIDVPTDNDRCFKKRTIIITLRLLRMIFTWCLIIIFLFGIVIYVSCIYAIEWAYDNEEDCLSSGNTEENCNICDLYVWKTFITYMCFIFYMCCSLCLCMTCMNLGLECFDYFDKQANSYTVCQQTVKEGTI